MTSINNIEEHLKRANVKPSYQRIKIFEYLVKNRNHPTVDMIYKDLVRTIPTLSKTTVYNTLKLFVENKVATIVNIEDNETKFDADTSIHGHFKCNVCNSIHDFNLDISKIKISGLDGFDTKEHHIYLKGTCNKCNN